ncbi:hypothetical protein [Maritimibacter sp. DP1N21-5]|uniref:hypothetical protein n=1 Tax=Maritimibacter sp. DP1N21-5 TaxID=2836867 RepID=UPI001C47F3AF|nr:hypothetical protein [Maritimibacter sp. DP1N21-5]MBV7408099.1 hypothetical protein [Maritimibacter sp. DP1N21-5]
MKPVFPMAAMAAVLALGACANNPLNGKDAALVDSSPGVDTSRLTPEGEADFLLAYQYVSTANPTTIMPNSGSARYVGGLGGDVTGDVSGFMTGALNMTVANLNNGNVSGFADSFALYNDDGTKAQDLSGTIALSGNVTGNALNATGAGALGHAGGSSAVNTGLAGTFRNLDGRASAVTGTATTTGGITMGDGHFYLVETD